MKRKEIWERVIHYLSAVTGGFLGGYTIFNHTDILGNAQTGNLIKMVLDLCEGDWTLVRFMLLSFLLYCSGMVFYVLVSRKAKVSMKIVSLICSAAAVVLVGAIPSVRNHFVACYPIIFAAPIQWCAFKNVSGVVSSTIFSSTNVLQATINTTNFILDRDKETAVRARLYWLTLLSFYCGVALSGVLGLWLRVYSVWFCLLPIALTGAAYFWELRMDN